MWHAIQIHGSQSLHNSFVEVSDENCHKQEYSILCHERFRQSIPDKTIVYVIEDAFLATTKIVEFHDVSCTRLVIVGQYTSVGIFAFPNIKVSLYSLLSLYDKTIRFSFPFLNKDGIQFKLKTIFQQFSIQLRQTWNHRRKNTCWNEYKNACNEPLSYLQFPPSMSCSPCAHDKYVLPKPPTA